MWNLNSLSSIAQKAKEAAARLESQLDDSIGIADESLFGATKSSSPASANAAAGGLSTTNEEVHDDLNEEDDFFSDNHVIKPSHEQMEQKTETKLEVNEYDDSHGEQMYEQTEEEEEVDFGEDGDGWEGEDIPLDEDELFVDEQQHQEVQVEEESREPVALAESSTVEVDMVQKPAVENQQIDLSEVQDVSTSPDDEAVKQSASEEGSTIVSLPPLNHEIVEDSPDKVEEPILEPEPLSYEEPLPTEQKESEIVTEVESFEPMEPVTTDHQSYENATEEESVGEVVNEMAEEDFALPADETPQPQIQAEVQDSPKLAAAPQMDETEKLQYLQTISQLEAQLLHREEQLASKSDQITTLTMQHESETTQLRQIITETKEEAKKRILKAKERVEEMQTKLADAVRRADAAGGSSHEQSEIIAALRAEGEQLARKQSTMEQSVRSAKSEARELAEQLQIQREGREAAMKKIEGLEKEVKSLKDELASARKGETLSKKLEGDLVNAKEESEKQRLSNLGLEQQLKELREENKSLKKEVEDAKAGAALESERESTKLKKERDDMLGDLESKLRTSEREANVREDALRHEVSELRKRWQDAVRRAEDLSMDVQHSTAPLLRQLESTERQNRARASAWAELETKLRSDVEEHVIQLEKLTKERNDLRASDKRLQRTLTEKEEELASSQETIDALTATIETLEEKVAKLEEKERHAKSEKDKLEKQASEGVSKIRSELTQSMIESEENYRSQIEALESEIADERQRRDNLMKQLDALAENVSTAEFSQTSGVSTGEKSSSEKEKRLLASTNQASILHDTLLGIDSDNDEDDEDDIVNLQGGSFAAMEQLSQGLRGAKLELEALRNQLALSEESRESLLAELAETRQAAEKLPLFESKVSELTMEVKLKDMEIEGLQEDIADVRFLYRQQLDALLEEKATEPHLTPLEEDEKAYVNVDTD